MANLSVSIEAFATQNAFVEQAVAITNNDCCVVAIMTKPFYLYSEKQAFINELQNEIAKKFNMKKVYITIKTDMFYQVSKFSHKEQVSAKDFEIIVKQIEK
ncbi:MAG: hypothetical protein RR454_03330 [Clostridia bacterium]